jgi:transposase, IS30 family
MPAPRLSWEKRLKARQALMMGMTQPEAAVVAGMSVRSVQALVAEAGGMPPRRTLSPGSCRLTLAEREEIRAGIERNDSFRTIAGGLGRSPSTISREVDANGGRENYQAWRAEQRAHDLAARPKASWFETQPEGWRRVQELLAKKWSPRQITGRLKVEFPELPERWVSHETIYRSIYIQPKARLRKELALCLRTGRARRRPQGRASRARGERFPAMVMISERPAEIEDRAVPGHWEGDLIIGKDNASAVATLVERQTRFGLLIKLENQTAEHVRDRIVEHVTTLPAQLLRSLTWDQGSEMAQHATFSVATGVPVYFCDPHSPWQRGTNENFNGLLRQFLPKGTDLSVHSQDDLDHIAELLNGRPRETLGFMTPSERINELLLR